MGRLTKREETNRKIAAKVSKMTPDRVNKLKYVFALDGTIEEACTYAEISKQTYYDWLKAKPELVDQFNKLRDDPVLKARKTSIDALDEPNHAHWYLERKRKKEFALRTENDITTQGEKIGETSEETRELIKKFNEFIKEHS